MSEKEKIMDNLLQELKRGNLVLSVLLNADEPSYGYSMVNTLKESGIDIEQNTLYPLLRRLEKQEILESTWDTSESRPRKYYKISKTGLKIRESLKTEWLHINEVLKKMMGEPE